MTEPDLAAIKAELRTLLEKAKTKPPWTWVAIGPGEGDIALGGAEDPDGEFAILTPYVCPACAERGASCMAPSQSDAALIIAAVNALPLLLADTPSVEPRGLAGALAILDVIDGIVDDTHPEGDGCPLCAALDELRDILGGTTR